MLHRDRWPFVPTHLSEIIDNDTLSVIEAGCAERLGRALTILDYDAAEHAPSRTDPINPRQNFEQFCRLLRDETRVQGGNAACEACDLAMAQAFRSLETDTAYTQFTCHMQLCDAAHVVRVGAHPVAVILAGQFQSKTGISGVQNAVAEIGQGRLAKIELLDDEIALALTAAATQLRPPPPDFQQQLEREASHVQRLAEAAYQRIKSDWEHEFLDQLRTAQRFDDEADLQQIRAQTVVLLQKVRRFCNCAYLVFFASLQENTTVLVPIAQVGLAVEESATLPHFNWKKGGLPLENRALKGLTHQQLQESVVKGVRGDNSSILQSASLIQPTMLGQHFRGALLMGPFREALDLQREHFFLSEIARIVGNYVLTEFQVLNLQQKQKQWESTAKLLTHQVRTALTPITTQVGMAKVLLQRPANSSTNKLVASSLKGAHELCLRLGKTVGETVNAHVLLLEPEDMKFEPFPLSVLVTNCVDAFALEVERRQRQLVLEDNVERLPQASVDIARLTIAFSNLIDNAIKYSFPNTRIVVRAIPPKIGEFDLKFVALEIQNEGDEILPEMRQRIFERGARGLIGAKLQRIPGTGLGLWEARSVIEAHGGTIAVSCTPTNNYFRQMRAHRVCFTVRLPIQQTEQMEDGYREY